jgi:hypothetical protein
MSTPETGVVDDRLLRQYLLGAVPEVEAERLDELSVADDEFASRLRAAENDLVDAHACGELAGEDLERFRSFYLSSARRREKARFAETFRSFTDRPTLVSMPRARSRRPWLAVAAGLMLFAGSFLAYQNLNLRREASQAESARAALQKRALELEGQIARDRTAGAEVQKELERLRKSPAQPKSRASVVFAAFLLPPPTRGAGGLTAVDLPAGAERATFELRLELDDSPAYRVALKDAGSEQVLWHSGSLKSTPLGADKVVSVSVPANLLKPRNYVLEVTAGSELIGAYPIRVGIR